MKYSDIKYVLILALSFTVNAQDVTYKIIQWVELMPEEDVKALYNPPEEIMGISEESESDMSEQVYETLMKAMDGNYQSALSSTKIIEALSNTKIKIPGFVVPLNIEGDKTTAFFIVPYFGACLHYPPPPPNQTIYAEYKPGFKLSQIQEPFNFSGLLTTSIKENEIATAAYHLEIAFVEDYTE